MTGVHDRIPLSTIVAPGRKTWGQHRAIRQEVERLDEWLEHLAQIEASAKKPFARMLARDHAERVRARLDTIVTHWARAGRPRA